MLTAVVGGGLQGVEAAYLALKAGWEVMIVDRKAGVPAARLGHLFLQEDVTGREDLVKLFPGVDLVIPALEDDAALRALVSLCRAAGIPLAFDPAAYAISSSKIKSDRLFARLGIPVPQPWPRCGFPLIVKPASSSGSKDVKIIRNIDELHSRFPDPGSAGDWVLQEYIEGPSYSLEIMGSPGSYKALQVTDLEMDALFDCKRVTAPTRLEPELVTRFADISLQIAEAISLRGIMDVEVVLNKGELKVLEIDARLPSQTPVTVYWSTGINMVELLAAVFAPANHDIKTSTEKTKNEQKFFGGSRGATLQKSPPGYQSKKITIKSKGIVLEHIKVSNNRLEVLGERIMKSAGPLQIRPGFFGADEAITDYAPGKSRWVATLIISGADGQEARERRDRVIKDIQKHHDLVIMND